MAEQNCSSPSTPSPVIITSSTEQAKSNVDDSNSLSGSCHSRNFVEKNCSSNDDKATCNNQSPQSVIKLLFHDPPSSSSSENKNGDVISAVGKTPAFLRPSILTSGFSSFASKNSENSKTDSTFSLQCPKLNLSGSKFGDASFVNSQKNPFVNSGSFGNNKSETFINNSSSQPETIFGNDSDTQSSKPTLGIFSNTLNPSSNSSVNKTPAPSIISVPNFVFGQNLHERVADSVKAASPKETLPTEVKSNGTSEMLFSSVLSSKEIKENFNSDSFNNPKETSSLIEDAARCQEARANKRKYEEVLVTTGEEDEQNMLQVNVKLFAFDNGAWVERGRGILRLNDKSTDEGTLSRMVIRTVGSLRVVLNTKIWSGMSLNRASDRSARVTAMDPNGQVKIFLIQASLKDMSFLYPLLEKRIKLCKDRESENEGSPQKKIALEKEKM